MFLNKKSRKQESKDLPPTPPSSAEAEKRRSVGLESLPPSLSALPSLMRAASVRQPLSKGDGSRETKPDNARSRHSMQDESISLQRLRHQLQTHAADMDKLKVEREKLASQHARELATLEKVKDEIREREARKIGLLEKKHESELIAKEQQLKAKNAEFEKLATENYNSARWWQQECEEMKGKNLNLEDAVKETETKFKEATERNSKLAAELDEATHIHQLEIQDLNRAAQVEKGKLLERLRDLEARLGEREAAHAAQLKSQHQEYQLSLAEQKQVYEAAIRDAEVRHSGEMTAVQAQLGDRIAELEQELINKPDGFRLGLDGSLKTKYGSLKLTVETITSPWNLGARAAADKIELVDETGFLERAGDGQWPFLLRAMVWARILDGFFSAPYGFGALGSGEGGSSLLGAYHALKRLLEGSEANPGPENFELLYRDKYANAWRSATFQSMLSAMETAAEQAGQEQTQVEDGKGPKPGISKVALDNRAKVRDEILGIVSFFCEGDVSDEIKDQVAAAVQQASELSMAFGAHRAKVCFGIPKFGDVVEIGAEFVDCQDGDLKRGKPETVELAVSPAMFMIGDGRNDLTTVVCLQHGEIYPVFQNE